MASTNISAARANLYKLAKSTIESHDPLTIHTKEGDVVMLARKDFDAMQESLNILQTMPGIAAEAKQAPDEDFVSKDDLEW